MPSGHPAPPHPDPMLLDNQVLPLLGCLSTAPSLSLEARTRAAHLKVTGDPNSALLEEPKHVSLPALGLLLHHQQVSSIHAVNHRGNPDARFELDFHQSDRRLDISPHDPRLFNSLTACFGDRTIPAAALAAIRRAARPTLRICPCCRRAAAKRAAEPDKHPLSGIFTQAMNDGGELQLRIENPSFSLATLFRPDTLEHSFGLVRARQGESTVFQASLSLVHCLRLRTVRTDGETRSEVAAYDMHGKQTFALSSAREGIMQAWMAICDAYFES